MSRWAAGVEYVGTAFCGWQAHAGLRCVQSELEAGLSKVANHPVLTIAAGRTDSGVHGLQQVVHFDSDARRSEYAWLLGTNTNLAQDLNVRWVKPVREDFSARFSARARHYRYVIHNHSARSALLLDRAAWWAQPLDAAAMHAAARALIGEQDFSAFRDSQCQAPTATRHLKSLEVFRRGDFVVMDVCANAFLHHMVRNFAGTLVEVGMGKRPVEWVAEVLAGRQRVKAGMTAPPGGLYFVGPEYPAEFVIPEPPAPWFPA